MGEGLLTAVELIERLRERYGRGNGYQWVFMTEVRNTTGHVPGERYADAVAMNLWPCKGLEIHGFEIKVSRGDFLQEMRNPRKAHEVKQYCDRWWLVIPSRDVIRAGRCPEDWGILCAHKEGLRMIKSAPKLDAVQICRGFLASLLRNASGGCGMGQTK